MKDDFSVKINGKTFPFTAVLMLKTTTLVHAVLNNVVFIHKLRVYWLFIFCLLGHNLEEDWFLLN